MTGLAAADAANRGKQVREKNEWDSLDIGFFEHASHGSVRPAVFKGICGLECVRNTGNFNIESGSGMEWNRVGALFSSGDDPMASGKTQPRDR